MQIFFVIDKLKDIDEKINLFQTYLNGEFKFFVDISLYPKIASSPFIIKNLAGVYEFTPSKKIDEYIKSEKYLPCETMVYYSSMSINVSLLKQIREKISYQYNTIFVKQKFNFLQRIFNSIYDKIVKFIFGDKDKLATIKLQFLSKKLMEELIETKFNNRIFEVEHLSEIECTDKTINKSMKVKFQLKKYNFYNYIFLALLIVSYLVCEIIFKLKFWAYIIFIFFMIMSILLVFLLITNNIFELRYENPKPNYSDSSKYND